jgi:trk system potassium uptake protein TrkH
VSLGVVQRILGILLTVFSLTMLPPVVVAILYDDPTAPTFLMVFGITMAMGVLLWVPVARDNRELRLRDGFVVVGLFWTVLSLFGALPLMAIGGADSLRPVDAVFESVSGLTTTGATVITLLEELPRSVLFYRQQLQWLGGMGIIVLAVAVLPLLGIGGMQLYRAETPGPMKDSKLTPRITETAKALWYIYLGLTIACGSAYWLAGMSPFDAIGHSFSTVAIGGFSTHDASIGYYDSATVYAVAVLFMVISGANFSLHFVALRRRSLHPYWEDSEFRTYAGFLVVVSVITVSYLYLTHWYDLQQSLIHGIFQVVSIATTTGFTTAEYFAWPGFLPVLLLFMSFIGGCAGSTGGGMKVIRFLLLWKQGQREIVRLIHPSAQVPVKIGRTRLAEEVVSAVWGFFALYIASFAVIMLVLMATGLDQVTAFSAVAACINNLGPGLGEVGTNYADINDVSKWVLCFAMLLGRLELFTLVVLITPTFWRH